MRVTSLTQVFYPVQKVWRRSPIAHFLMLLKLYQAPPFIWCVLKSEITINFFIFPCLQFRVQYAFLTFLAKFRSTMSIKSNFLYFHFREFTAAITPRLGRELEKMTSNTQKYLTDENNNNNNNKCRKLITWTKRAEFLICFLYLLFLLLLVGSTLTLSENLLRGLKFSKGRFLQISLSFPITLKTIFRKYYKLVQNTRKCTHFD